MIFQMNIILMLSAIIPDLDCCSSFKLFNRKSIRLYPVGGIELSIHKSLKFQHGHRSHHHYLHQEQQPKSPLAPPDTFKSLTLHQLHSPGHKDKDDVHFDGDDVGGKDESELEDDNSSFWHRYFQFLGFGKQQNLRTNHTEELTLKLNRSIRIDIENQGAHKLTSNDHQPSQGYVSSLSSSPTTNALPTSTITTTDRQFFTEKRQQNQDDLQFKLITEIITLECVDILKWEFCLNGGRCFLYPILNHTLSSCECAEGFVGERCEAKSYEFIPWIRPRISLAKTNGGPLVYGLAVVDVLFLLFLFCKNYYRD